MSEPTDDMTRKGSPLELTQDDAVMSAKTSKAPTETFFKALAETGNQTISAERARVSRSWVTLHRSTDPEFKARMQAAITEAREPL